MAPDDVDAVRDPLAGEQPLIDQSFTLRHRYPVLFTRGMFAPENRTLLDVLTRSRSTPRAKVLVVVDQGVRDATPGLFASIAAYFAAHEGELESVREPRTMVGGEEAKNDPDAVQQILKSLFETRLDRHSYMLVIGGGAVLDAAGYAAALFHRGMRLVRAPSTVLGQGDAGIGVKNGVNAFGVKNALGTFAPPYAVINDAAFLDTLSSRDHVAGIAEAIKVALIRDASFFDWIELHADALRAREKSATATVIQRGAALHLAHICEGGDPFETGSSRPLDFGHWSAHKLESLSDHALRHGEAVAIGMSLDTRYAELIGLLGKVDAARIQSVIQRVGLPTFHPTLELTDEQGTLLVLRGLEEFREHLGGNLSVTLLSSIGRGVEVHEIDTPKMRAAIASAPR